MISCKASQKQMANLQGWANPRNPAINRDLCDRPWRGNMIGGLVAETTKLELCSSIPFDGIAMLQQSLPGQHL